MTLKENGISQIGLVEHFSSGIKRESKDLLPPLSESTIHYLTQLLIYFSESKRLFQLENGVRLLPTLAMLYEDAYNAKTRQQRNAILRQLGDSALFMGALFCDYFSNKGLTKDYFIGMGGGAYSALVDYDYGDSHVFYELAEKFPKLLQVVAHVCAVELNYNAEEIFSLLERWQHSQDEMLRKQLHSIGIVPFGFNRKH